VRLIVIGCEYVGKTTLTRQITGWMEQSLGRGEWGAYGWHDHFVRPFGEGTGPEVEEEIKHVMAMPPKLLEKYSRYMTQYHMADAFMILDTHHLLVNWYYADAVYAPLYYGYGGRDQYADRQEMARHYDAEVMKREPRTVLVHLKASAEVVRQRRAAAPHEWDILQDQDIETVLQRFQEEYIRAGLRRRFEIDTSSLSIEETFAEFLTKMEPHFSETDRLLFLAHERGIQRAQR
jgi:hypothetical protein